MPSLQAGHMTRPSREFLRNTCNRKHTQARSVDLGDWTDAINMHEMGAAAEKHLVCSRLSETQATYTTNQEAESNLTRDCSADARYAVTHAGLTA
jgi:hypothetical protein